MNKQENKIALIGSYGNGKTLTALCLSELLDIPRAHVENIDSLYKDIYGVHKSPKYYTTPELFSVGLARFHSRIRQEKRSGFISDGSVLNELAYGYARMKMSKSSKKWSLKNLLYKKMYRDFGFRLERTIVDYAKTAYDHIFYLKIEDLDRKVSETNLEFEKYFDEEMMRLLNNNGIKFKILRGALESFVTEIYETTNKNTVNAETLKQIIQQSVNAKQQFPEDFHFGK